MRPRVAARGCTAAAGFPESLPISVQPPAAAAPRTAGSQRARHERVTSHRACCVRRAAVARRRQWSYGPLCTESLLLLTRPSFPLLPSPLATGTGVVTPPRPLTCVALGGMQTAGLTHAAAPRLSRGRSARRQTAAACAVAGAVPVYSGMRRCGAVDLVSSGRVSSGRACLAAAVATSTRRAARGGPTRLATTAMFEVRHPTAATPALGRRGRAQAQGGDLRGWGVSPKARPAQPGRLGGAWVVPRPLWVCICLSRVLTRAHVVHPLRSGSRRRRSRSSCLRRRRPAGWATTSWAPSRCEAAGQRVLRRGRSDTDLVVCWHVSSLWHCGGLPSLLPDHAGPHRRGYRHRRQGAEEHGDQPEGGAH